LVIIRKRREGGRKSVKCKRKGAYGEDVCVRQRRRGKRRGLFFTDKEKKKKGKSLF